MEIDTFFAKPFFIVCQILLRAEIRLKNQSLVGVILTRFLYSGQGGFKDTYIVIE